MDLLPPVIRRLVPPDKGVLVGEISDQRVLGDAVLRLLNHLVECLYTGQLKQCRKLSEVLLDIIWEKLNTGHWKDVSLAWRLSYSLVSFMKALAECCVVITGGMAETEHSVTPQSILKTCDMGLLMGAPFRDNVLAKLATTVQNILVTVDNDQYKRTELKESVKTYGNSPDVSGDAHGDVTWSSPNKSGDNGEDDTDKLHYRVNRQSLKSENKNRTDKNHDFQSKIRKCIEIPSQSCPSLETFRTVYMAKKCPVVIDDSIKYWPAFSNRRWSVSYIKELAGYRTVPIEIGSKYTEDSWTQKLMTVGEFIDRYIDSREGPEEVGYLAQHQLFDQIPELRDDVIIPDYCAISDRDDADEDVDINAWFGPCGTISPLHFDPKHNLLVQVVGEKYIQLFGEEQTKYVYPHSGLLLSNTSQVDVEKPDLEKFPEFSKAQFSECVLKAGQMLYIPPKCWHYVRSLDVSFSVSFWWS